MRLAQVAQRAVDLDRAVDFYTVLLETDVVARFLPPAPPQAFFELEGGTRLLLSPQSPSSMLYLRVENVHGTLERLAGLADVVTPPHLIYTHSDDRLGPVDHEEWQAFLRDSEGNLVGLIAFQSA